MKVIIKKGDQYESADPFLLQQGGAVVGNNQVFGSVYKGVDTRPIGSSTTTDEKKKSKSDSKNDIIDKNLLNKLIGKGITSDVDANVEELIQLQSSYDDLESVDKNSRQGIALLSQMQTASKKVNQLLRNAEVFKDGQTQTVQKNAMSEIAVTSSGLILQGPNGKIIQISPEEYTSLSKEEKEVYKPLTNAQLINSREQDLPMQGDMLSFEQLNNSTGFMNIQTQIKEVMGSITSSKNSQSYDQYTDPTGKLKEGLQGLRQMSDTPIDNILVTISQEGNESSAVQALDAMWSGLSDNHKTFLKSRAGLAGYSKDQLETVAKSYLVKLISPKIVKSSTTETKVDLATAKKQGAGGAEGDQSDKTEFKFWDAFANDKIPRELTTLSPEGSAYQIVAPIGLYGPIRNKAQEPYTNTPLGQITELNTLNDKDAGSFGGDMVLNNATQEGIAYNGDSLARITLPYKMDPHTHKVVPDLNYAKGYELQIKEIKSLEKSGKKLTVGERQKIFTKNGMTNLDINGNPKNVKDFSALQVYVGEVTYDNLDEVSQKNLVLDESEGQRAIMKGTYNKNKFNTNLFSGNDDIYKGIIYYPINANIGVLSGTFNDAGGIKIGDWTNRTAKYQMDAGISNQSMRQNLDINQLNNAQLKQNVGH